MPTFIRLTDYRDSDSKEAGFFNPNNRYAVNQDNFSKIPSCPIAYWGGKNVIKLFSNHHPLRDFAPPKSGQNTGNNELFLKFWNEVNYTNIKFGTKSLDETKIDHPKWYPYNKGGEFRRWYGNFENIINWSNDGKDIKAYAVVRNNGKHWSRYIQNLDVMLKEGLTYSFLSTTNLAVRYTPVGHLFDYAGCSLFPSNVDQFFVLGFLNSKVSVFLVAATNPTMGFQPGTVGGLPFIFKNENSISTIVKENVHTSKVEWDSRETSWDFKQNELIRHKTVDGNLSSAYQTYCDYWREKFTQLHTNEEELNRLFIDIYELQDELTPDVDLGDITILKQESKIVDSELVFQADEIMKQFVSYGVGCMFGRYSLDQEGLVVANMNQEIPTNTTFEIDDDNVIPVLEDDYFIDDIASRFIEFVKVAFGADHHAENIRFIEDALGTTIRKYFVKGFYEDHIKRYKKRPIYWMVSSPKKSFNALIYMHRYQDDIFARIQNNYLREYISKLEASSHTATTIANDESNSSADRKKATKEIDDIAKKLDEIIKFDRDKLTQFAQSRTTIDLDDGVKVNYCKFEEILYPISGLCK